MNIAEEDYNLAYLQFPNLVNDADFKFYGDKDPNYNCIAYAAFVKDEFWSALPRDKRPSYNLDGVKINWPFDVDGDWELTTLIEIFHHLGYEECDSGELQEGYRKIALYGNEVEATHAARQLTQGEHKGKWTSKLGGWYLIIHGTPYTIESGTYGNVLQFMIKNIS